MALRAPAIRHRDLRLVTFAYRPRIESDTTQVLAAIAIGANLPSQVGDPSATVTHAIASLGALARTTLRRASTLHTTRAVSTVPQPDYVNAAAILSTSLTPRELLDALLGIERAYGRERSLSHDPSRHRPVDAASIQAWHARPLDLDLILYADRVIDEPGLTIPHPRLHVRRFVLAPLAEIAPDWLVPVHSRTVRDLFLSLPAE